MKRILFLITLFTSLITIDAHAISLAGQQIRIALHNKDYIQLKQILAEHPQITLHEIVQVGNEGGKELFEFLDALVHHTNWLEDMQLFLLTNKALRSAYSHNLHPSIRRQITPLMEKVQNATQVQTPVVRPMDPNYNLESINISKEALSGRPQDKNIIVHISNKYLRKPYKKWQRSQERMSFSQYLKVRASRSEKKKIHQNTVIYLSPTEAQQYVVTFENEKLMQNGRIMNDGLFIFTLDARTTALFAAPKRTEHFHHSSFTRGEPVLCAGKFYVKNGEISVVQLKSGHYKPTAKDGEKFRHYLSEPSRLGGKAAKLVIRAKILRKANKNH